MSDLFSLTVKELQVLCRLHNFKVSGRKSELVERLSPVYLEEKSSDIEVDKITTTFEEIDIGCTNPDDFEIYEEEYHYIYKLACMIAHNFFSRGLTNGYLKQCVEKCKTESLPIERQHLLSQAVFLVFNNETRGMDFEKGTQTIKQLLVNASKKL